VLSGMLLALHNDHEKKWRVLEQVRSDQSSPSTRGLPWLQHPASSQHQAIGHALGHADFARRCYNVLRAANAL
jgi:hypothetical protein